MTQPKEQMPEKIYVRNANFVNGIIPAQIRQSTIFKDVRYIKDDLFQNITLDDLYAEWYQCHEEMDFYEWIVKIKCPNGLKITEILKDEGDFSNEPQRQK